MSGGIGWCERGAANTKTSVVLNIRPTTSIPPLTQFSKSQNIAHFEFSLPGCNPTTPAPGENPDIRFVEFADPAGDPFSFDSGDSPVGAAVPVDAPSHPTGSIFGTCSHCAGGGG